MLAVAKIADAKTPDRRLCIRKSKTPKFPLLHPPHWLMPVVSLRARRSALKWRLLPMKHNDSASRPAIAATQHPAAHDARDGENPATLPRRGTAHDPLLLEGEAAEYLGVSARTVQKWRQTGEGPLFLRINRSIRYRRSVLDAFLRACECTSTSSAPVHSDPDLTTVEISPTKLAASAAKPG